MCSSAAHVKTGCCKHGCTDAVYADIWRRLKQIHLSRSLKHSSDTHHIQQPQTSITLLPTIKTLKTDVGSPLLQQLQAKAYIGDLRSCHNMTCKLMLPCQSQATTLISTAMVMPAAAMLPSSDIAVIIPVRKQDCYCSVQVATALKGTQHRLLPAPPLTCRAAEMVVALLGFRVWPLALRS